MHTQLSTIALKSLSYYDNAGNEINTFVTMRHTCVT